MQEKLRKGVSTGEKSSFSLNKKMKGMFREEAEEKGNPVKGAGERQGIWTEK